jgi:hypothetical protein
LGFVMSGVFALRTAAKCSNGYMNPEVSTGKRAGPDYWVRVAQR